MSKINFRGGFSDRNNLMPFNTQIQIDAFDERTRIKLLNLLKTQYENACKSLGSIKFKREFCYYMVDNIFVMPISNRNSINESLVWNKLKDIILNGSYNEVLDAVEGVVIGISNQYYYPASKKVFTEVNNLFKKEYVGYRFVDCKISSISDENELKSIDECFENSDKTVKAHLSKALSYLSNRENPDYENSIKESICAVEAECSSVLGLAKGKSTLPKTLQKLEANGIVVHPSLKEAFNKLYGYTSDASGIRHGSNIGGSNSTFAEAKFMLVSCCAFINYLTESQSEIEKE